MREYKNFYRLDIYLSLKNIYSCYPEIPYKEENQKTIISIINSSN